MCEAGCEGEYEYIELVTWWVIVTWWAERPGE